MEGYWARLDDGVLYLNLPDLQWQGRVKDIQVFDLTTKWKTEAFGVRVLMSLRLSDKERPLQADFGTNPSVNAVEAVARVAFFAGCLDTNVKAAKHAPTTWWYEAPKAV